MSEIPTTPASRATIPTAPADDQLATMYEGHRAELLRFAVRTCRDPEIGADLVHEAFLRLVVEIEAGRTPDNVRAWLHRVVTNLAISLGRHTVVSRRLAGALVVRDEPDRPDAIVLGRELRADIAQALATLPGDARTALLLAAHGYSGNEICTAIGRTNVATRTMMSRARRQLRAQLQPGPFAA